MLTVKLFSNNSGALERYLNQKAGKGYILQSIVPFIPFPPLEFTAFSFKKENGSNRTYRVDYRKLKEEDRADYYQLFLEDGWHAFPYQNNKIHIFHTYSMDKAEIYSDEDSRLERNRNQAVSQFLRGMILVAIFALLSVFYPMPYSSQNGIVGFLSSYFYIIVALGILIISTIRYFKNKQ